AFLCARATVRFCSCAVFRNLAFSKRREPGDPCVARASVHPVRRVSYVGSPASPRPSIMPVDLRQRKYALDIDPAAMDGQDVVVAGWIQETRDMGGIAFVILRDRTGTLQVVLPKKKLSPELVESLTKPQRESVVAILGTVKKSEK